ncbi:DUF4376 domain-containing protein [Parasedimentitalea huanghaiensis]|uniref:DUF4376 domain-containing protein n=1 Tax=Parasedimentitalea huanghaiensis TaxID=2682100 RepID=A0A6L6WHS6_9RHOB|nr:DUF4376 domain-containing protein [Zongyanglinia huanghaiensis]MVO16861.1 DUF4376 domain-containing protein [Zongyanglinia huanghaiensis]
MKPVRAAQIDPETNDVTGVVTCMEHMLVPPYYLLEDGHPMQSAEGWKLDAGTGTLVYTAPAITGDQVTAERDARIEAGFTFGGHVFDCDAASRQNISGAASLALGAMTQGALAGNLRWHGAADDFAWLTRDNVLVPMDAQSVFAFGAAAAEHVRVHVFAARALKNIDPIPTDFDADFHWPAQTPPAAT